MKTKVRPLCNHPVCHAPLSSCGTLVTATCNTFPGPDVMAVTRAGLICAENKSPGLRSSQGDQEIRADDEYARPAKRQQLARPAEHSTNTGTQAAGIVDPATTRADPSAQVHATPTKAAGRDSSSQIPAAAAPSSVLKPAPRKPEDAATRAPEPRVGASSDAAPGPTRFARPAANGLAWPNRNQPPQSQQPLQVDLSRFRRPGQGTTSTRPGPAAKPAGALPYRSRQAQPSRGAARAARCVHHDQLPDSVA